jgi:hypothetical protein
MTASPTTQLAHSHDLAGMVSRVLQTRATLEAGNLVANQLEDLARADSVGIVVGTRVPIVLTSRADNVRTRFASTAVTALVADARREEPPAGAWR